MKDFLIGTVTTLLSAFIIGLWGTVIVLPFQTQQKIHKAVLRVLRNYKDPRDYQGMFTPTSLMLDIMKKQCDQIEEIIDLIQEQRELNKFTCWLFNYDRLEANLHFLFEYIRNPIMLDEQKEFEDNYALDTDKFFADIRKTAKLPKLKLGLIFLIAPLCLLLGVALSMYLVSLG